MFAIPVEYIFQFVNIKYVENHWQKFVVERKPFLEYSLSTVVSRLFRCTAKEKNKEQPSQDFWEAKQCPLFHVSRCDNLLLLQAPKNLAVSGRNNSLNIDAGIFWF